MLAIVMWGGLAALSQKTPAIAEATAGGAAAEGASGADRQSPVDAGAAAGGQRPSSNSTAPAQVPAPNAPDGASQAAASNTAASNVAAGATPPSGSAPTAPESQPPRATSPFLTPIPTGAAVAPSPEPAPAPVIANEPALAASPPVAERAPPSAQSPSQGAPAAPLGGNFLFGEAPPGKTPAAGAPGVAGPPDAGARPAESPAAAEGDESTARAAIEMRLEERLPPIDFPKATLREFVEFISEFSTVTIVFDGESLSKAGKGPMTTISVRLKNATVSEALATALGRHGLVATPRAGKLVITAAAR